MLRLSQRALAFQESAIRKLDAGVARRTDVIFHRLNIGQPDVETPEPLLEAIERFPDYVRKSHGGVLKYGPASGLPECRASAAAYHAKWSPGLTADNAIVTHGGSEALLFAFAAICDAGDTLLAPEPYYTNYNGFAKLVDVGIEAIPTSLEQGFELPSDDVLDSLVTEKTRGFVFSNPANPTGKIYEKSELERLAAWTKRHGLWLISDEVYRRIWFKEPPPSALELEDDHIIIIDSLSKTYSACGARLGFFLSKNEMLMERAERLGQARLGPQPLAQYVAMAAHQMDDAYYEATRLRYAARIDALLRALSKIEGVRTQRPDGAFYLMCSLPVEDSERFARFLALDFAHEGESVVVAPAPGFYDAPTKGGNEVRLAAVVEEARLERAAELLGIALSQYRD